MPKITYFQFIFERPKLHFSETPFIFIVIPPKKRFPPPVRLGGGVAGAAGWRAGWVGWLAGLAGLVGLAGWLVGLAGWLAGWLVGWLAWLG